MEVNSYFQPRFNNNGKVFTIFIVINGNNLKQV